VFLLCRSRMSFAKLLIAGIFVAVAIVTLIEEALV
jgi:hypothetical protein